MKDFDLADGTMALPLWPDQVILEVVSHWHMDDAYTDDDPDDDTADDTDNGDTDYDDDEAIWPWWWYWWW